VVRPEDVGAALAVCDRAGLRASRIGEVTGTGRLEVYESGRLAADVPAASLGQGPLYDRPVKPPESAGRQGPVSVDAPEDLGRAFLDLISAPNIALKHWAWEQYDHQVMLGTVMLPGHDAAVIRLPGSRSRIAVTTDGHGRWCFLDPYRGTLHTVAEAARNLSCAGAEPAAVTNCLNFGNPEVPEIMWQFTESIRGLAEGCDAFGAPVVSGNVSFYNQTGDQAIHPTPVIGMVGIVPEGVKPPGAGFKRPDEVICLLGKTRDELGGGEYLASVLGRTEGLLPALDIDQEKAVQRVVTQAIARELLSSAHDCSSGGVAAALAESCGIGGIGARVAPEPGIAAHLWLFSESASRILVSLAADRLPDLQRLSRENATPMVPLGRTVTGVLEVEGSFSHPLEKVRSAWANGLSLRLENR
ncbi:MAG: AIR synthase related protein, partial [Actinomycetota bacterium]